MPNLARPESISGVSWGEPGKSSDQFLGLLPHPDEYENLRQWPVANRPSDLKTFISTEFIIFSTGVIVYTYA